MQEIVVRSSRAEELIDITAQVQEAIRDWTSSACLVYVPHTTAGVLINEHADPDVARDVTVALHRIVPDEPGLYRHAEGNSPAHVKAILVGSSQIVPLSGGRLRLGTWQGIFLAEFDGPRTRRVQLIPL